MEKTKVRRNVAWWEACSDDDYLEANKIVLENSHIQFEAALKQVLERRQNRGRTEQSGGRPGASLHQENDELEQEPDSDVEQPERQSEDELI